MRLENGPETPRLVELVSGVDALYASSRTDVTTDFFKTLTEMKAFAGENDLVLPLLNISDERFEVSNYSWGRYPVFMEHEFGRLGFTKSEKLPGIRLQIRSKFLHAVGAEKALDWFTQKLHEIAVHPAWTLSRLDLFADVQGWDLHHYDQEQFITRASDLTSRKVSNRFSGFEFGRRKTGSINARIYDKTLEMLKSPNGWTFEQWGSRFQHDLPVWRIEFEFHTRLLREVGIPTAEQGLARRSELWAYATDKWLTHRDIGEDSNKSRWPISSEWTQIQNVDLRGKSVAIERIRESEDDLALQRLIPGLHGYLTSVGARLGATDLSSALDVAFDVIDCEEKAGRRSTSEILEYKKNRFRK